MLGNTFKRVYGVIYLGRKLWRKLKLKYKVRLSLSLIPQNRRNHLTRLVEAGPVLK